MELGAVFMSLMGGPPSPTRPFATWVDQAERLFQTMEQARFTFAVFSHAYQASLAGGMQPTPLIAPAGPRLRPNLRLAVQVHAPPPAQSHGRCLQRRLPRPDHRRAPRPRHRSGLPPHGA